MNRSIRHWREVLRKDAPLVFMKRLLINGVQQEPGYPMTDELKKQIGEHRLKLWWESKAIRLATPKDVAAHEERMMKLAAQEADKLAAEEAAKLAELEASLKLPVDEPVVEVATVTVVEPVVEFIDPDARLHAEQAVAKPKIARKPLGKKSS